MNTMQGLTLLTIAFILSSCNQPPADPKPTRKELSIRDAFEEDFRRTYDPALGYPPKERLILAYKQIERMQKELAQRRSLGIENPKFIERGPNNIGGRTRTILIDLRDPERKTIWAGSVAGGLWKTTDISAPNPEWITVNDYLANLAIGAMIQDPTNPDVFYVGTGEGFPNFEAVRGLGIFKSMDGGVSWSLLPGTDNTLFRFTRAMVVHPETGHVYAATRDGGVRRSGDGGQTWTKVLGTTVGASDDNMYDLSYSKGRLFASNATNIYTSTSGDRGMWTEITANNSGFPTNLARTEFSVCEEDINIIYAVGSLNGGASDVYRTNNGGTNWTAVASPAEGDFTNGQAWYDLEIGVDPFNCNHVIVGGVSIYRTLNGGAGWQRFNDQMHVDQHKILFDPLQQDVVHFGNDGGLWRSTNGSNTDPSNKNLGYITTQYYACALHPDTFSNYFLGGTQDNGSHRVNGSGGTASGDNVWGGDGFYCHIDQDDANIQMVSSQGGNWGLSTNGGVNFSGGQDVNGGFITPSDYDSKSKILYTQTFDADFYRWNVVTNLLEPVDITGSGGGLTYVQVDPAIDNRVYFGTGDGVVIRVDTAHIGATVTGKIILNQAGTISGIDILPDDPLRIIVTQSNYGVDNVLLTSNGGLNWTVVDGNLPDMPVRAVLFNPRDGNQAMIATEAGVWTTALLDSANTIWIPPAEGRGIPITRTDDLEIRSSDYVVLAATHGRGLWTTSVFSDARAKFFAPLVHYVNAPVQFNGDASLNAESFAWAFGDGETSTEANPLHFYNAIGEYNVTLTINGSLSTSDRIKILPDGELPYVKGREYFGGSFDGHPEQYGVHTVSGSGFEQGNSGISGKNGTKSGDNAFVIGLNEPKYKPNSESYLYLPVFDFSTESIYTFSFWARYFLHPGPDGFMIEYTTNRGLSWQALGSNADPKWYNFNNSGANTTAFPDGTSYFTNEVGGYTNYTHDLTFLSGKKDVAFRFVFRSESTGFHVGLAIDDVEIFAYEGELKTALPVFNGEFGIDKEIKLNWATNPEYYCKRFIVERSVNGNDFEEIDQVQAKSILSANTTTYTHTSNGGRDLYFYRLKVINENDETNYYYEFYSDIITLRRNPEDPVTVHNLYPNPFTDHVNITFNDVVDQNVLFEVFDLAGRRVLEKTTFVNSPFYLLQLSKWPQGVYYLSIRIGAEEEKVYPMLSR